MRLNASLPSFPPAPTACNSPAWMKKQNKKCPHEIGLLPDMTPTLLFWQDCTTGHGRPKRKSSLVCRSVPKVSAASPSAQTGHGAHTPLTATESINRIF